MADDFTKEQLAKADKDGDGVIEWSEIPRWKKSPFSVIRGADGAISSKRVGAFFCLGAGLWGSYLGWDNMIIIAWLSLAAALWGVSLGEKKL